MNFGAMSGKYEIIVEIGINMTNRYVFIFLIVLLASAPISCTTEPESFTYKVVISNLSGNAVNISLFSEKQLFETVDLDPSEQYECMYNTESFRGLRECLNSERAGIDSIRFVFSDGRGYVCTHLESFSDLCFGNNRLLFSGVSGDAFRDNGDNQYEFILDPEDFLNAKSL